MLFLFLRGRFIGFQGSVDLGTAADDCLRPEMLDGNPLLIDQILRLPFGEADMVSDCTDAPKQVVVIIRLIAIARHTLDLREQTAVTLVMMP